MSNISAQEIADAKVGQLAADHPAATRVFARHGLDYCCGGGRPLREACKTKGIDLNRLIGEIRRELADAPSPGEDWSQAPLAELTRHIVRTYHRPLGEELPRLESMTRKVVRAHGERDPERLEDLLAVFLGLRAELETHMRKEESVLFPMIEAGRGAGTAAPISVMEHEHEEAAAALRRIRELTDDYAPPEGACTTWRALWHGLESLERDLREHIHLENNILFPRALGEYDGPPGGVRK